MTWLKLMARQWRLLLAASLAACAVHIWTTLSAMEEATVPGYARLAESLPVNRITYLPPVTPAAQPLPFMMPDALYTVCRFDAGKTPIRLVAELPEAGWSLSLHAPNGDNFFFVPGKDDRVTRLEFILQRSGTNVLSTPRTGASTAVEIPKIILPAPQGLAILRAPIKGLAYIALADRQRNTLGCKPVHTAIATR